MKIKQQNRLFALDVLVGISMFLLIVFPNSFREIKFPLFGILFLISTKDLLAINKKVFIYYILGVIVTVFYIIVGLEKAKMPDESTAQVLFVYVITPLMWIGISNFVFKRYSLNIILKFLNSYAIIGCLTVFLGIWLFDIGRLDLLEYVIDNPNKTLTDNGIIEMRLFVYGSLIFLIPAFIQLNDVYKNKLKYFTIILLFFITAVVSGRSALLLSIFFGIAFFGILNLRAKLIKYVMIFIFLGISTIFLFNLFGVNLMNILNEFLLKIALGGEDARTKQFTSLVNGIGNNIFGAGHGVGVEYIRSFDYPWRYEILPLALIYRIGFLGTIIYALPFFYSVHKYLSLKMKSNIDNYMIVGLVSIIIASFTNPYLESFEFQFFYVFPFIYFTGSSNVPRLKEESNKV